MVDLHTKIQKDGITFRETQTIYHVLRGLLNRDIAKKLFIAEKTVKWRLTRVYKKLGLTNRYQLIIKYLPTYLEVEANKPKSLVVDELPLGVAL